MLHPIIIKGVKFVYLIVIIPIDQQEVYAEVPRRGIEEHNIFATMEDFNNRNEEKK